MSIFRKLTEGEHRSISYQDVWGRGGYWNGGDVDNTGLTKAGRLVNQDNALRLVTVWACVSLIADAVGSLPLDAYRKSGTIRQVVNPTPTLLTQPNTEQTRPDFVHRVIASMLLSGNSYSVISRRVDDGTPVELTPVSPRHVRIERDPDTKRRVYVVTDGAESQRFSDYQMMHIPLFTMPGNDKGLSPIEYARQAIGLGMATEEFGSRWFGEGANPSSVLETDANLDENQAKILKQRFIEAHGARNREPAVLSGGVKWRPITISPEDSQFLETRKFQTAEIARLYRVPPHLIGDVDRTTSWGSGIEEQGIGFVTYTLAPILQRIELALSALLPKPQFVKFNVDALMRGSSTNRADFYLKARNAGWMNVDEIREKEDLPPVPDGSGSSFIQPLNFGPLGADPSKGTPPP